MVDAQTISIVFAGMSIGLAAIYYMLTLRNSQKAQQLQLETRQAQLLMNLYETYRSLEFRRHSNIVWELEWTDYDDFWEKYGGENNADVWAAWQSVAAYYHGIGVLLKRGLVDVSMIDELMSNLIYAQWHVMEPIIIGWRKMIKVEQKNRNIDSLRTHEVMDGFEYLYHDLQRYMKEHPELQIK